MQDFIVLAETMIWFLVGAIILRQLLRWASGAWSRLKESPRFRRVIVDLFGSVSQDELRRRFNARFEQLKYQSPLGHSHRRAATERTQASMSIKAFIKDLGMEPYVVSTSSRDSGEVGSHGYYMAKDVQFAAREDALKKEHVVMMVDVDYYTDPTEWLQKGNAVMMYTFVPDRVAGQVPDGVFTIQNNEVHYRVNGGGRYQHRLWDYGMDWLRVDGYTGSWFCSVEQKQFGDQHRVVMINPVKYVRWAGRLIPGPTLKRRQFETADGTVNRMDRITPSGELRVSLGRPGIYTCLDVPNTVYEAARIRISHSSKPDIHTVEKYMRTPGTGFEPEQATLQAPVLFDIMMSHPGQMGIEISAGIPQNYQCFGDVRDGFSAAEEGRVLGRTVAPQLTNEPAVVPRDSANNDLQCVIGRVENVSNDVKPHGRFNNYANEFAKLVVGESAHTGSPWSLDQVNEVQNRPTQRNRTDQVYQFVCTLAQTIWIAAFMKKEAYSGVNDPRNISQVPTQHTLRLSGYTYAFKQAVLSKFAWYSPGKTPVSIARRVGELARGGAVAATDFSRYDGTISRFLREKIERACYVLWAGLDHKSTLGSLLAAEYKAAGRTKNGVQYNAGFGRLSGSPLTTDGNTLINAFVSFAAMRDEGYSPKEAMRRLGAYAGDDGLTHVSKTRMEATAKGLGLNLKCDVIEDGPIPYLGRIFVDPKGTDDSIQDPVRTLKKLHITFADSDVPKEVALFNRAKGYFDLDPNAPIVGDWCRKVLELLKEKSEEAGKAWEKCWKDRPYYSGWPSASKEDAEPIVAKELGIDVEAVRKICDTIEAVTSLEELPEDLVPTPDQDKDIARRTGDARPLPQPARRPRRARTAKFRRGHSDTDSGRSSH